MFYSRGDIIIFLFFIFIFFSDRNIGKTNKSGEHLIHWSENRGFEGCHLEPTEPDGNKLVERNSFSNNVINQWISLGEPGIAALSQH